MAIVASNLYAGRITTDDTGYPLGKAQDIINGEKGTGTPLRASWVNDQWGFLQALLDAANISPSGTPDQVGQSDYLDAVNKLIREPLALKIFQSPTDGGLTEIQTRTVEASEVYEVRKTSDGEFATIYSNASGATEIVQDGTSNVSDSAGVVEFYIEEQRGDIKIESSGVGGVFNNYGFNSYYSSRNPNTLQEAIDDVNVRVGDVLRVGGYNTKGVGAGTWDVVDKNTVTTNATGIRQCTGNVDAALVLRVGETLSPTQLGAAGGGLVNESSTINATIALASENKVPVVLPSKFKIDSTIKIPQDLYIYGLGDYTGFVVDTSGIAILNIIGNNCRLKAFKIYGKASGGIQLRAEGDSSVIENTTLEDITIEGIDQANRISQCVWLWGSKNTKVLNCNFKKTGYGVLIQFGNQADDVLVHGCSFTAMTSDAVEANSGGDVISSRWVVSNNSYMGDARYPYNGNEGRFAGFASVNDIIITGNTVTNAGGDSAVHIETNSSATVITNNTFTDCYGAQGNIGWVYLLNSEKESTITGNTFIYNNDVGIQSAISVSSGFYEHTSTWSNNVFLDNTGLRRFYAISAKAVLSTSHIVISGNTGRGLGVFLELSNSSRVNMIGNSVECDIGVWNNAGATGGGVSNMVISSNSIDADTYAVLLNTNTNGTGRSKAVLINGNIFNGDVLLRGEDCQFSNNIIGEGFTLTTTSNVRLEKNGNSQVGIGPI